MRRRIGAIRGLAVAALLLITLIWSVPATGSSHGFMITSPTASSVWHPGDTVTITWTGGSTSTHVNLSLVDVAAWTVAASIASGVPNNGSYTWTVPATILAGRSYLIYIENMDRTIWAYGKSFPMEDPDGRPDLAIAKKPDGPLVAGQQGAYLLQVTNVGTGSAYGPIIVTDTLPSGLSYVSGTGTGWLCAISGGTVTCTYAGNVPAGTALPPITLTVLVADDAKGVGNCAAVRTEEEQEENLANNRDCVDTPVEEPPTGMLCGVKFDDQNGNGQWDDGEPALSGWTILLLDEDGNVVASAVTGDDGTYCFDGLFAGTYTVSEVGQPGWSQTYPAAPGSHTVTLDADKPGADGLLFGNHHEPRPGRICGIKFHDRNGNGVQDPGEPGLGGWTIQMTDAAGNVVATVTSARGGRFCFTNVKSGTYTFAEVMKPGWTQTAPAAPGTYTVTLQSGDNGVVLLFGNQPGQDPCCLTFTFDAGRPDRFGTGDGPEPASPSPDLEASIPGPLGTGFDGQRLDRFFAHTFALPAGNCIESARLEVMARPLGSSLSANDTIALRFTGVAGSDTWGAHFGSGYPNSLLGSPWTVGNYGGGQLLTLDLESLPGGADLLDDLDAQRFLDLVIQDDTAVDFVRLTVEFCECEAADDDGTLEPAPAKPGIER